MSEMMVGADEAFDTIAARRLHDLGESKEGQKDELDNKISRTQKQSRNTRSRRHAPLV